MHTRHTKFFIVLIAAAILLRVPLLFRPVPQFYSRPFIEDAYYSLTVARSLGYGNGLTIDGERRTNGIQPLIVFLYAPAFAAFDDDTALRVCLGIGILIELLLIIMVRRFIAVMGRGRPLAGRAANIAALFLLFGYASTVYTLNGLETGLAAALAVAVGLHYFRIIQSERQSDILPFAALGALGGLAVLARIDAAFLVAAVFALHAFGYKSRQIAPKKRLMQSLVFGAAAIAVSSPWWIYNHVYFGSVTPTSGLSQRVVIPVWQNFLALIEYLANKAFIIGYLPYTPELHALHIAIVAIVAIVVLAVAFSHRIRRRAMRFFKRLSEHWQFAPLLPLALYVAAMAAYYVLNFGAPHFLQRYLFPGHVIWIIAAGIAAAEIWARAEARSASFARFLAGSAVVIVLAVYAVPYSWNFSPAKARQNDFLQVSEYIKRELPAHARIGMGQSGTAGFFNANVVNLDGKVNADVFLANESGRLCAYIDSARFDYLIDWQHFFAVIDSCAVSATYSPIDTVGRFLVYRRKE